jgi:hypothetical protein
MSQFDPTETWAAQDFRGAKALFVQRDIVPSIGMHTTSGGEESHGNPHPMTSSCAARFNTSGHIPIPRVAASEDPSYSPPC